MTTLAPKKTTIVKCPTCKTDVIWGEVSPYRPFCSKQCQMIDFGEWAMKKKLSQVRPICRILMVGLKDKTNK